MAFEPGGIADKLGNRYEGRWVAKQLIKLINEDLLSVTVEPIGPEEQGVDLVIVKNSGIKQLQQCKSRLGYNENLTVSVLKNSGILNHLKNHLSRDLEQEFAIISPLPGLQLADICESARISNDSPKDFFEYQTKSKKRSEAVEQFFHAFGLSFQNDEDCKMVFKFLKRFFIELFPDDKNTWSDLLTWSGFLFSGEPETAISTLLSFIENENKFRKPIYADELRQYLAKKHNISPKQLEHDSRIAPVIEELQRQFSDSIVPGLIQEKLITRSETSQIIETIEKNNDVVLHGVAGNGKSSVLYELIRSLQDRSIPYLPIRLDRRIPHQTAKNYGASLGLPESPACSLAGFAGNRKCVLILDQLDAIRWTSAHSKAAMDVCKELLREILALRNNGKAIVAVVACRSFDLENDPEIKHLLKSSENNNFNRIVVGEFSAEQLRDVIGPDIDVLTAAQQKILRCPQNLSIWIQMTAEGLRPQFQSATELMRRFWDNFRQTLEGIGISAGELESFLGQLLDYMEKRGEGSAPECLVTQKPQINNALKSYGILQNAASRVSFCHQKHLDFLVAERIARSVLSGTGSVVEWLGGKEQQTLFRREQLRQLLCLLVDQSASDFYDVAKQIIESANVRFHLKSLVLEITGQLAEVSSNLGKYCLTLIEDEKWRDHVYETVFLRHPPWIFFLIRTGKISEWLCSSNEYWVNKGLLLLRSVVEDVPDMVAEILSPLVEKNENWPSRIFSVLSLRESLDSDKIFDLRRTLARKGFVKDWVDWQSLARKFPLRPIMLIEAVCSTWKDSDEKKKKYSKSRLERWYDQDLVELNNVATENYRETWDLLMPQVNRLTNSTEEDFGYRLQKWRDYDFGHGKTDIHRGIVELLIASGKELARKEPEEFLIRIAALNKSSSIVVQEIIGEAFASLSTGYEDKGILWLLENPSRFELGFGYHEATWMPAVRLIKKLSKDCSDKLFERLEFSIIHHHSPNEKQNAEYCLKRWHDGYFGHYWGKAQYFLLPALDEKRTKKQTKDLISVLKRKFEDCSPSYFLRSSPSSGGWVGSKLEQNLDKIPDKHWLRIISNKNVAEKNHYKWLQTAPNKVVESSVRQFSGSLMRIARRFPERFGDLALRFGDDTHPSYVSAIIEGFIGRSPEQGESESEKHTWTPAKLETIEAVLDKFHSFHDRETAAAFCSLISEKSGENWSDRTITRLINYACKHPDLQPGKLNINCDVSCDDASVSTLFDNVANCVRGKAAMAIGRLLWDKQSLFEKLAPTISSLVRDPHPVIRIAAIQTLFPVLNIDKNRAVKWFFTACEDDLRVAASPMAVRFFNYVFPEYFKLAEPVVQKMICSENPEIAFQGARQVAARNFFYDMFEKEFNDCLFGTGIQRKGVVDVAVSIFNEGKHQERCNPVLIQAMNDESQEVRETLNELFNNNKNLSDIAHIELINKYTKSKAFADNPDYLVGALTEFCGQSDLIAEAVFAVCERFPGLFKENEEKPDLRLSFRADEMFSVLIRVYENAQCENNLQIANRCLDMWDLLLEKRIGRATELTKAIDK